MRVDSSSISFKDAQEVLDMFQSNRLQQLIRILQKQFVNAQILVFSRSEKMRKMRALAGTEL